MKQKYLTEVQEKGERWYRKLKKKLEPNLNGKVIVIAVDSGLYVFGDDDVDANKAFKRFIGPGNKGYGRRIGPDLSTAKVSA